MSSKGSTQGGSQRPGTKAAAKAPKRCVPESEVAEQEAKKTKTVAKVGAEYTCKCCEESSKDHFC